MYEQQRETQSLMQLYEEAEGRRKSAYKKAEREKTHIVDIICDVKEREICTVWEVHLKLAAETR